MKKLAFFIGLLIVFLGIGRTDVNAQPVNPQNDRQRLIIKFKPQTSKSSKDKTLTGQGILRHENLRLTDAFVLEVPKANTVRIVETLRKNSNVSYVEEDFIAQKFEVPNDPRFSDQWGLTKIQAASGWDKTHGGNQVDIAITDTGIDGSHPDLSGKISTSVNCTINSSCPTVTSTDVDGHGSHVAGIASAVTNNGTGIAGTAWDGRLMNVKVLDDTGSGYYSWVINGIVFAADNGAEVINLSLGGSSSSSSLREAIDYAWGKGKVLVAAAGNGGSSWRTYPAYYYNTIAVAATDENDRKASFSNYGTWVDVSSPGTNILSTYQGGYEYFSGTSMSTPFVSGLAALLFGQNPGWTNNQVRGRIESTADKIAGTGSYWTYGRINVCKAVECTQASTPAPTPTVTPTVTPTNTPTPTQSSTPSPTPTSSPLPWWCVYIPWHYTCQ